MGLFDFFGGKGSDGALKRHAARVANKRAQAPDRWESIQALAAMRKSEAVAALLLRFTYITDPTITDQEEKDAAFEAIIETGTPALDPVKAFLRKSESIAWPLRILDKLLSSEEVVGELVDVLDAMDTEYERDPERKLALLGALEERQDPRIVPSAGRFLADVHETARFTAAGALLAQHPRGAAGFPAGPVADSVRAALETALASETSVRVKMRILDAFAERGWELASPHREAIGKSLPPGYTLDPKGVPRKRP